MLIIIQVLIMVFLAKLFNTEPAHIGEVANSNVPNAASMASVSKSVANKEIRIATSRIVNSKALVAFLTETAGDRMLALEESKLAVQRATSKEITNYGQLMVNDQKRMLAEIRAIAKARNITLPKKLPQEKIEILKELKSFDGNFDKKFIKVAKSDHRRDIRKFKNDMESSDPEVARLSAKYRSITKSHLDKIKSL